VNESSVHPPPRHRGVGVLVADPARGLYLLQQKDERYRPFPYGFSFFGGEIEPGETPEEAACREVGEELDPAFADALRRCTTAVVFTGELEGDGDHAAWHMTVLEWQVDSRLFDRLAAAPVREGRGSVVVDRPTLRSLRLIWGLERTLVPHLR
jgi:ADP-ribose pyrophosphatase YjhB (NUDIX family)